MGKGRTTYTLEPNPITKKAFFFYFGFDGDMHPTELPSRQYKGWKLTKLKTRLHEKSHLNHKILLLVSVAS